MRPGATTVRGLLGCAATLALLAAACSGPMLRDGDSVQLERQGNALRGTVERYRAAHAGRCPASLAEAGVSPERLATRFGRWRYECAPGDSAFALQVGDYGRNGFVLYWSGDHWSWDE